MKPLTLERGDEESIDIESATGDDGSHSGRPRLNLLRWTRFEEGGVLAALLLLVVIVALNEPRFLSVASLVNVASGASYYGILALGIVFLLAMREIDLSVGAIYAVTTLLIAILVREGLDPWLAAAGGIVIGVALGGINGLLANALRLPAIIVTLGTLSLYRGLTLVISGGYAVGTDSESSFFSIVGGRVARVSASTIALLVLGIALTFVFRRTRFGYLVRSIGSNEQAARLSGIKVERVRLKATMLTGALCGIAGVLTFAFFGGAEPSIGSGYELLAIAAAVIGGTGLAGGSGTIPGAVIGALLISTIQSALVAIGVSANYSQFATGGLIVGAVALDAMVRRRLRSK